MNTFFRFLAAATLSFAFFASGTPVFAAASCPSGVAAENLPDYPACKNYCNGQGYGDGQWYSMELKNDDTYVNGDNAGACCCVQETPPPSCDDLIAAKFTDGEKHDFCSLHSECFSHPLCIQFLQDDVCAEVERAKQSGMSISDMCKGVAASKCPACAGWVPGDGGGGAFDELCTAVHEAILGGASQSDACNGEQASACPDCAGYAGFNVCDDLALTLAKNPELKDTLCTVSMYKVCTECGGPGWSPAPALQVEEWQPGMGLGGAARSVSGKSRVDGGLATALSNAKYNTLSPGEIAGKVIKVILQILGLFFLIMVVYAGVQWLTAAGDEKRIAESVRILWASVVGMAIAIAAYAFTVYLLNVIKAASG